MFCENCGKQIPDGQRLCAACGGQTPQPEPYIPPSQQRRAPVQEPSYAPNVQTYEPPVQTYEPPVQTFEPPVQTYEPPVQKYEPPAQSYAPPVQPYQPPVQTRTEPRKPAFELNMPAEKKPKKKGGGGKIVMIIVALLLVAGIVLAAINWGSIVRFFKRSFSDPTEYLKDVEASNASALAADVGKLVETGKNMTAEEVAANTTLTLEVGDSVTAVLEQLLAAEGMDMKLDWLKTVDLDMSTTVQKTVCAMDVGVGINGSHLLTASVIMDMERMKLWVAIPELNKTFLEVDLMAMYNVSSAEVHEMMTQTMTMTTRLMESMPDGAELEELVNKFFAIVLDHFEDVEKENETIEVDGVEQTLLVMSVELTEKDILEIALEVLEKAKDDKTVKLLMNGMTEYMNAMPDAYETVDLYEQFREAADELIYELEDAKEEAENETMLAISTYLDGEDKIVGREISVSADGEKTKLSYITVRQGDKFAAEAKLAGVKLEGKGTIVKGKTTGSYVLSAYGTDFVTLELENFLVADNGTATGTLRLIPDEGLLEEMDLDGSVLSTLGGNVALELALKENGCKLSLLVGKNSLLGLGLTAKETEVKDIQVPTDAVSFDDDEAGMKWLSEISFDTLVGNLEKANVPDEVMSIVEMVAASFAEEFK